MTFLKNNTEDTAATSPLSNDRTQTKGATFKIPLGEDGNLQDIYLLNAVRWMSDKYGYEPTIEFVSHATQQAINDAVIAAIPVAADTPKVNATDAVTTKVVNDGLEQLPKDEVQPELIDYSAWGGKSNEPTEECLGVAPAGSKAEQWTPVPAGKCYTTKEAADKIGITSRALGCNKSLQKELGVQQMDKNHKLLFPKCKVNAYRKALIEKKNGLVLQH